MSTSPTQRIALDARLRHLTVRTVTTLSSAMRRVELEGPELDGFECFGPSDHAKVFFPTEPGGTPELPEEHEEACRMHFISYTVRPVEMTYDDARPGYLLGYVAAGNPDYRGRSYDDVERDLRRGFTDDFADRYDTVRDYARFGFERGTTGW